MAYNKTTWEDRNVQYPNRYIDELSNIKTFTVSPGTITKVGTDITASKMNNLESEIEFLSNRHATTANTGNAYTLTITNSKYNYDVGHTVVFTANATNTGGATLNVNGKGAKTFKKEIEGSLIDLFYGDIASGRIYEAIYDGTYFILKRPSRRDEFYQASSVGNDAYAVSLSNEMIYNFSVYNGLTVRMKADVSNIGAATLSVNGAAAKTIKKVTNDGVEDLQDNNIIAGGLYTLIFDGTYFQLQNPTQYMPKIGSFTGDATNNRFINVGFTPKMVTLWTTNASNQKIMTFTIHSSIYGVQAINAGSHIYEMTNSAWGAEITTNGFVISTGGNLNINGYTHVWYAS